MALFTADGLGSEQLALSSLARSRDPSKVEGLVNR
jgi:hypothetical protein